jgi:acetyltransferase-like isoleucine patch superfamily enzyme
VEKRINTTGDAKEIIINKYVWIGTNSIILPGTNIGYASVLSAGSVVADYAPSMYIAGGIPAIVILTEVNLFVHLDNYRIYYGKYKLY